MKINVTVYALLALSLMIGGAIGSGSGSVRSTNDTLKLCNEKPHECKFKYDIFDERSLNLIKL